MACSACEGREAYDWRNRELAWKYGPTNGISSRAHVECAGATDKPALAEGWRITLVDGKRLLVAPYKLAESHPRFGKVVMAILLFDFHEKELGTVFSEPIDKDSAAFALPVDEEIAKQTYDAIVIFRDA